MDHKGDENARWAPAPDARIDYDRSDDGLVVWAARPIYRPPTEMRFFNFGVRHDGGTQLEPAFDKDFDEILACLPEEVRATSKPTHYRPPAAQEFDWGIFLGGLGALSAAWQLLGAPGAIQLGQKIRSWLRKKRRSGDAGALLPVAIVHIVEMFPDAQPSPERVQILNPIKLAAHTRHHQVIYLYRIYDLRNTHVYVVELASTGHLVSCTQRPIAMFESPGHHGDLKWNEDGGESDPVLQGQTDELSEVPEHPTMNPIDESWNPTSESLAPTSER